MSNEWHDIEDIDQFREDYEFNAFVVVVDDPDDEVCGVYQDIVFGVDQIPELTKRFFCVPYNHE